MPHDGPRIHPLAHLLSGPQLADAACIGRWELFDPRAEDEDDEDVAWRHEHAIAICWSCPAWTQCAALAEQVDLGGTVVAGRVLARSSTSPGHRT